MSLLDWYLQHRVDLVAILVPRHFPESHSAEKVTSMTVVWSTWAYCAFSIDPYPNLAQPGYLEQYSS